MNRKKNLSFFTFISAVLLLSVFTVENVASEALVSPEWGYSLDLPEGYTLENRNGSNRYHFVHQMYPVDLHMALYPRTQFHSATEALHFVTSQLKAENSSVSTTWRYRSASIAQLSFEDKEGWALSVELGEQKGYLVMACFTDAERASEYEELIISTLDSVFTDEGSFFEAGPMTSFAWAKEKDLTKFFQDSDQKIPVPFNSIDAEANQSVVDREFNLLTGYLNSPLMITAWKRYYRLIYRDAWARLMKPSFLVQNTLPVEPRKKAEQLLAWTQSFDYERNLEGSDFTNLCEAFYTKKADCDSRSLLLVLLLNQMGIDAVLLVSPEYSHSVAAIDCPGEGARFTVGNKTYVIADTTAKVGMGLIAQDMADTNKWFAVTFYGFPQ